MEPEVTVTVGSGGAVQRPRPSWLMRLMEIAGLALVLYGLASMTLFLVLPGIGLILGIYAIYRRKHGFGPGARETWDKGSMGDDGGGGD